MINFRGFMAGISAVSILSMTLPALADNTPQNTAPPMADSTGRSIINVNPASKARIKIESDTYDFGSILKGTTVVHSYIVKNIGTDTLIVSRVRPTCGCTLAPLSSDHIAPGKEATIRAAFNTQKFNGRVNKTIYIDCNDPVNPYLKVSFTAIINNPLAVIQTDPLEADFGNLKKGVNGEVKVHLTNTASTPLELAVAEQSTPIIKVKFTNNHLAPNASTDLVLDYSPQSSGDFRESITINSPGNDDSKITIPIKGTVAQ